MTNIHNSVKDMEVPPSIAPFVGKCPPLLQGESEDQYYAMFDLLMDEMQPDTSTEWLLFADVVSLFWELGRYRNWKGAILNIYRRSALETALRQTHRSHAIVGDVVALINIARKEAEEWRTDPQKRAALDARLAENGYDETTLNAEAFLEAIEPLAKIERFLSSARGQLSIMLKEAHVRKKFAARARHALEKHLESSAQTPKQIGPN
jgi:hypothetical protein